MGSTPSKHHDDSIPRNSFTTEPSSTNDHYLLYSVICGGNGQPQGLSLFQCDRTAADQLAPCLPFCWNASRSIW